jgi:hypothetical protein
MSDKMRIGCISDSARGRPFYARRVAQSESSELNTQRNRSYCDDSESMTRNAHHLLVRDGLLTIGYHK